MEFTYKVTAGVPMDLQLSAQIRIAGNSFVKFSPDQFIREFLLKI